MKEVLRWYHRVLGCNETVFVHDISNIIAFTDMRPKKVDSVFSQFVSLWVDNRLSFIFIGFIFSFVDGFAWHVFVVALLVFP